jgi:hypothetical protein
VNQARTKPPVPSLEPPHMHIDLAVYMSRSSACMYVPLCTCTTLPLFVIANNTALDGMINRNVRPVLQAYMFHSVRALNRFFPFTNVRWAINHFSGPTVCCIPHPFVSRVRLLVHSNLYWFHETQWPPIVTSRIKRFSGSA